jgi:hypothetical protein
VGQIPEGAKQYQFKKGTSGNPGGRPRRRVLSEAYAAQLELEVPKEVRVAMKLKEGATWADAIAVGLTRRAVRGGHEAARELREAVEGKAVQRLSIDAEGTIDLQVVYAEPVADPFSNYATAAERERARSRVLDMQTNSQRQIEIASQANKELAGETAGSETAATSPLDAIASPTAGEASEAKPTDTPANAE